MDNKMILFWFPLYVCVGSPQIFVLLGLTHHIIICVYFVDVKIGAEWRNEWVLLYLQNSVGAHVCK